MLRYLNLMLDQVAYLDKRTWLLVGLGVLAVGFFCMRGYGSRKNY